MRALRNQLTGATQCSRAFPALSSKLKFMLEDPAMEILRTPDERFTDLPGYDFAPHYVGIGHDDIAMRVHYLDEGPRDTAPVLLLHGAPSRCYL
jgi:hypothetical protein